MFYNLSSNNFFITILNSKFASENRIRVKVRMFFDSFLPSQEHSSVFKLHLPKTKVFGRVESNFCCREMSTI